jgi:hypothetical protein
MKRLFLLLNLTSLLSAADLNGVWNFSLISFGEEISPARVTFHVEGDKLTGTLNELKLEGTADANGSVKIKATRPDGELFGSIEGEYKDGALSGVVKRENETLTWKAHRVVTPTPGPPQRSL